VGRPEDQPAQADRPRHEVEIKLRVPDGAALAAVEAAAGGVARGVVRQVNHLFDTADLDLQEARSMLRLRDEDGRFSVTAKAPETAECDGLLTRRREAEVEVDAALAERIRAGDLSPLEPLRADPGCGDVVALLVEHGRGKPLRLVGRFETVRRRRAAALDCGGTDVDLVLELDTVTFPGGVVHHEVEVEVPGGVDAVAVKEAVDELFARAGVRPWSTSSKAARFFRALGGETID